MHSFNDLAFVREKFRCQGKITGSGLGYIDMDLIGDMSRTPGQDIDPVREQDRLINIMGDEEGREMDLFHHIQVPPVDRRFGNGVQGREGLIQQGDALAEQIGAQQGSRCRIPPESWAG